MVAFEESTLAMTREQQNMFALRKPRIGDKWHERVYLPAGEVELVLMDRYVVVLLSEGDRRFWSLEEYADHYLYKHGSRDATWCDVTLSPVRYEPLALEWYVYFFFNRWRQKWRSRMDRWGKVPRSLKLGRWTLKLERNAR